MRSYGTWCGGAACGASASSGVGSQRAHWRGLCRPRAACAPPQACRAKRRVCPWPPTHTCSVRSCSGASHRRTRRCGTRTLRGGRGTCARAYAVYRVSPRRLPRNHVSRCMCVRCVRPKRCAAPSRSSSDAVKRVSCTCAQHSPTGISRRTLRLHQRPCMRRCAWRS